MPRLRDWRPLALLALCLLFARLVGGKLPYYTFWLSLGLVGGCFFWTWNLGRTLVTYLDVSHSHGVRGQPLPVRLKVENTGLLPAAWLEVRDNTPRTLVDCDFPDQATSVPPSASRVLRFTLIPGRRGHFPVGPVRLATGDPFGIFGIEMELFSRRLITVHPRAAPLGDLTIPLAQPFGPARTRQRAFEDPASLAGIRPWRPGDSLRHIHWRTSARRGDLYLKEYELAATTELHIFLDLQAAVQQGEGDAATEETTVELAASLARLARRRGLAYSLTGYGTVRYHLPPGRGALQFARALELLARVHADGAMPLDWVLEHQAGHLSHRCSLAVITPALTPALAGRLLRLSNRHKLWLAVIEPAGPTPDAKTGPARLLAGRGADVYICPAGADLHTLPERRVLAQGVMPWRAYAQSAVFRS